MAAFLAVLLLAMVAPAATASFPTCPAGESAQAAADAAGFSSPTCPSADHSLMKAAGVLSKTGSRSMALALMRTPGFHNSPFLTVFSPIDPPFDRHSFPPLSSFQLHFSPSHFSSSQLQSLPLGHRIPTLHPTRSLVVTAAGGHLKIGLNDVDVRVTPIYDDGYAAIYRAYNVLGRSWGYGGDDHTDEFDSCLATAASRRGDDQEENSFSEAAAVLRRGGFSAAAAFLEAQLLRPVPGQTRVTLFAPPDAAVGTNQPRAWLVPRDILVLDQVDLRHHAEFVGVLVANAVPCRLAWSDLVEMEEGSLLQTYSELGFRLRVTRTDGVLAVNGAPVGFPDLYKSNSLVVHGLSPAAYIAVNSVVVNCSAKLGGAKNSTDRGCRMLTRILLGPLLRPPPTSLSAARADRPPVVNCSTAVDLNPGENPFARASDVLKRTKGVGFSSSAALLDAQLVHHFEGKTLTFFAPSDAAIMAELPPASSGFGELHDMLSKYIAPCTPASSPTGEIRAVLPTFADGHFIRFELDYTGTVNGIRVAMPNLYEGHSITIHGLRLALPPPEYLPFLPESCPKGMPDYVLNYLIAASLSFLLASLCHKECVRSAARRREQALMG